MAKEQESASSVLGTDWTNILEMDFRIKDQLKIPTGRKTKVTKNDIEKSNKKIETAKKTITSVGYKKRSVKIKVNKLKSEMSNAQIIQAYKDIELFERTQDIARWTIKQEGRLLSVLTGKNVQLLIKGLISTYIIDKKEFLKQKSQAIYILRKELRKVAYYKGRTFENLIPEGQLNGFNIQEQRIKNNILILQGRDNEIVGEEKYPIFYQVFKSRGVINLK